MNFGVKILMMRSNVFLNFVYQMMRIVNEMLELGRMHKEHFSVTLPEEWDLYSLRVVFRGDVRTNYNEEEYGV